MGLSFIEKELSLDDFVALGTMTKETMDSLKFQIASKSNIVLYGPVQGGKTTLLGALMREANEKKPRNNDIELVYIPLQNEIMDNGNHLSTILLAEQILEESFSTAITAACYNSPDTLFVDGVRDTASLLAIKDAVESGVNVVLTMDAYGYENVSNRAFHLSNKSHAVMDWFEKTFQQRISVNKDGIEISNEWSQSLLFDKKEK